MKYNNIEEFKKVDSFGVGEFNKDYAQYFKGNSYLNVLTNPLSDPLFVANVTFEPGCINNWHIHKATSGGGQILICTFGEGWYQEENKEPIELKEGMVITIPANTKHWHGAKKDSWFSHIAFEVEGTDKTNDWLEAVDIDYYNSL